MQAKLTFQGFLSKFMLHTQPQNRNINKQQNKEMKMSIQNKVITMGILSTILTACYGKRPDDLNVNTPCPTSPNCASSTTTQEDKRVDPFTLTHTNQWEGFKSSVKSLPRVSVIKEDDNTLQTEFRTKLMRYVDDVIFQRNETRVDVRSSSRIGYSDLGANKKRIEEIRTKLKAENIIQ